MWLRTTRRSAAHRLTFEPGVYDADRARQMLDVVRAAGFNSVRVLIDPGSTDAVAAHGIGPGMGTSEAVQDPYRVPGRGAALSIDGVADLLDIHTYPNASLYRTWDTRDSLANQPPLFHMDEAGGAIYQQLASNARPDPCVA